MTDELRRGSRLGKHELLLRIGRGGMATVWVAREHAETRERDRLVAVKAILADLANDPEFVKMFLDEGRLVESIHHPNVVDVYEVGEHDGIMFMAMEWVEGDSLHSVIAEAGKRRPIPPEMAVRIIADAATGLHAAHELKDSKGKLLGVVHRDVSPHNILIGTDGAIKLVDFGVAKAMGRLSDATSAGQLKGKFGYMSPEQAMAKAVDRRSDVFSLGIVLFELTTGRRLFRGEHDAETLHLVVSGQIPKPSRIDDKYPPRLEEIVMRALERDVDKRYQTALDLCKDLDQYLKEERIVVAQAGVAQLLKRVMGTRIEQRRRALRATLRALGGHSTTTDLLSSDPAFTPTGMNRQGEFDAPGGPSSLSGMSPPGSQPSAPTSSYTGVSQPRSSTDAVAPGRGGRGSMLGYVVAILGLGVALVVVLSVALGRHRTTTRIVDVAAPGAAPTVVLSAPAPAPSTSADDRAPTLSVDKLREQDGGTARRVRRYRASSHRKHEAPTAPPTKARAASPTVPDGLPRKNPYAQ